MKNGTIKTNKTRIIVLILLLCTFTLVLSSCGSEKIEKPDDTNLEYWLLDKPDVSDCTQIYCGDPYREKFLAQGYTAIVDEKGNLTAPGEAVVYSVEMYPYRDLKLGTKRIVCINITDPEVHAWGLTINSTHEEIVETLKNVGYTIHQDYEDSITFTIDMTWFVNIIYGKLMTISHATYYIYHLNFDAPLYLP